MPAPYKLAGIIGLIAIPLGFGVPAVMRARVDRMRTHAALNEIFHLNQTLLQSEAGGAVAPDALALAFHEQARMLRERATSSAQVRSLDRLEAGVGRWAALYERYRAFALQGSEGQADRVMEEEIAPQIQCILETSETLFGP